MLSYFQAGTLKQRKKLIMAGTIILFAKLVGAAICIAFVSWLYHKAELRKSRRKKDMCCDRNPEKKFQVIHVEGDVFRCYKFTVCAICGLVKFRESENDEHRLSKWKLAYRHFRYPEQFYLDEDLFRQAGLIGTVIPSLSQRILLFQAHLEQERSHTNRHEQFASRAQIHVPEVRSFARDNRSVLSA